jgi:hypothetical protein
MLLPQYERPSFKPVQNNKQNYISKFIDICVFGKESVRQEILHEMTASIP